MNRLQILDFRGCRIRMVIRDGEPWWVARDVCEVLEIGNPSMATGRLDEDEVSSTEVIDSLGRAQRTTIVNESGLYSLILGSRKPEAREFKRWVTHEVLPSIRRTGSYSVAPQFRIPQTFAEALRLAADQAEEIERQRETIRQLEPKAEFHDRVASSEDGLSIADVAKTLGTGEIRLFRWLRENGILLRTRDEWNLPRQEYLERGYFKLQKQTWTDTKGRERISTKTLVTGKGLVWLQRQWDADNRPSDAAARRPQLSLVQ